MDANLTIALIAGGAALVGSLVGQLGPVVHHLLSVRQARRIVLRERYERMATLVGDVNLAINAGYTNAARALGRVSRSDVPRTDAVRAGNELRMLATLYFPEFSELADRYCYVAMSLTTLLEFDGIAPAPSEEQRALGVEHRELRARIDKLLRDNAYRCT